MKNTVYITLSVCLLSIITFGVYHRATDASLPKCNSENVIQSLNNILEMDDPEILSLQDIQEINIDKKNQLRTCKATLLLIQKLKKDTQFKIYWENKEEKSFYVQLYKEDQ